MRALYLKHIKESRIITIISFWIIQGLIIHYFLDATNGGGNDSETDAVILIKATVILLMSVFLMFSISFNLENNSKWRLIFSISILLIPIVWVVLIVYTGNPLYHYV